jgi:hypothetical protein
MTNLDEKKIVELVHEILRYDEPANIEAQLRELMDTWFLHDHGCSFTEDEKAAVYIPFLTISNFLKKLQEIKNAQLVTELK